MNQLQPLELRVVRRSGRGGSDELQAHQRGRDHDQAQPDADLTAPPAATARFSRISASELVRIGHGYSSVGRHRQHRRPGTSPHWGKP